MVSHIIIKDTGSFSKRWVTLFFGLIRPFGHLLQQEKENPSVHEAIMI